MVLYHTLGRLIAAVLMASIIGWERQVRHKPAGVRTHALVGLGSALVMIVSQTGFNEVLSPGRVVLDPSRIAAQAVSGIGFLGAGLIIVRRDLVRGLTTAATIWVCAAIGLACGSGMIAAAGATTTVAVLVSYSHTWITDRRQQARRNCVTIRIVCQGHDSHLPQISDLLSRNGSAIVLTGLERSQEKSSLSYEFCKNEDTALDTVADLLLNIECVIAVHIQRNESDDSE